MIIDKELELSLAQVVTVSAASTNYIDQQNEGDAYEKELYVVARVGTAFTVGTSMEISLQTDDNTSFTSPKTVGTSGVILEADLTENTIVWSARIPKGMEQYIRGYYTVVGTHTTGTIDLFFTPDVPQRRV